MFTHHCSACDRRQLIFMSQVTSLAGVDGATELAFTCWCGAEQSVSTAGSDERVAAA